MTKIDFVVETERSDKNDIRPLTALLFLITGVYGELLFFKSIPGVTYSGVVFLLPAVLCAMLWYSYFFRKRLCLFFLAIAAVISCVSAFVIKDRLLFQLMQIADSISGKTDWEAIPVTELAFVFAAGITVVWFVLEMILKGHSILYLLTTGLMLLLPLLGIRPGSGAVVLSAFFQLTFWALYLPGGAVCRALRGKSMQITAVLFSASLLIVFPLVDHYAQEFYRLVFEVEGYAHRTASQLSGKANDRITGGRIHSGNNYRTGTGHLELTISRQPTQALYLRGFSGGEYVGADWIRASDEKLFSAMTKELDWGEWEYMVSGMYNNMYFEVNRNMQREEFLIPFFLTIRHLNGRYGNTYVPYYSRRERAWTSAEPNGYMYSYYEQADMAEQWDNATEGFENRREWYRELQDAYMEEIQTAYTQVPAGLLPRMTKLVEENPMAGLNEISTFILYTLHSNASYTLTPGWAPLNEDIAEYFLFESGRGYCEHFALAATLMYRMYGIPARYATGYMIEPAAFELQKDGTYHAIVTDENAHAWTEIFLENYGWTPIEMTPAADGSVSAGYPGFDRLELNRILTKKHWNIHIPSLSQAGISPDNGTEAGGEPVFGWRIDLKRHERALWTLGTILIYSLFLVPVFLDYRRLRHLKKMETMSCRKVFSKLIQMLHFAGYFREYDGSEKEFADAFAARIPEISSDEIRMVQRIVCKAAYSAEMPAAEKEQFVRNIYFCTGSFLYKGLKWKSKLLFRYWNTFG